MEELKAKYGFTEEQIDDIRDLVIKSLKEIIPVVIEESTATLAEKCKETIMQTTSNCFPSKKSPPSREVLRFVAINKQSWKLQLTEGNKLYGQFIRCESLLDIYGLCLQEEPVYIPKRYRHDKVHVLYDEEKNIRTTANLQNMQADMEVLKIRRDNYKRMLDKCDESSLKFINEKAKDPSMVQDILSIWNESVKQDQEKVDKTWAKKIASMHTAFEKDKENLSRQQDGSKNTPLSDDMNVSDIDSDDDDDDDDNDSIEVENAIQEKPTQKQVHFPSNTKAPSSKGPRKNRNYTSASMINRQVNQYHPIQRTIQNDAFVPNTTTPTSDSKMSKNIYSSNF